MAKYSKQKKKMRETFNHPASIQNATGTKSNELSMRRAFFNAV